MPNQIYFSPKKKYDVEFRETVRGVNVGMQLVKKMHAFIRNLIQKDEFGNAPVLGYSLSNRNKILHKMPSLFFISVSKPSYH